MICLTEEGVRPITFLNFLLRTTLREPLFKVNRDRANTKYILILKLRAKYYLTNDLYDNHSRIFS